MANDLNDGWYGFRVVAAQDVDRIPKTPREVVKLYQDRIASGQLSPRQPVVAALHLNPAPWPDNVVLLPVPIEWMVRRAQGDRRIFRDILLELEAEQRRFEHAMRRGKPDTA